MTTTSNPLSNAKPREHTYRFDGQAASELAHLQDLNPSILDLPPADARRAYAQLVDDLSETLAHPQTMWNKELAIVEVTESNVRGTEPGIDGVLFLEPDQVHLLLTLLNIGRVERAVLTKLGDPHVAMLALHGPHQHRILRLDTPADSIRFDLAKELHESGPSADGTPLMAHLNQLPRHHAEMLRVLMNSDAKVVPSDSGGARPKPAHQHHYWSLDTAARNSGLYDLPPREHAAVIRLLPTWHLSLAELRDMATVLASPSPQA